MRHHAGMLSTQANSLIKNVFICTSIGVYYLENSYILASTKLLLCILKKTKVKQKQFMYNCQHSQVIGPMLILHWNGRFWCKNYGALESPQSSSDTTRDIFFKWDSTEWQHKIGKRDMRQPQNLRFPIDGRSGSFISLILCGRFISLTAETARAGAADKPAYKQNQQRCLISILIKQKKLTRNKEFVSRADFLPLFNANINSIMPI